MSLIIKYFLPLFLFVCFCFACVYQKEDNTEKYHLEIPSNFKQNIKYSPTNPLKKSGIELGRKLFYDPILSSNNKISCASCHQQDKAFSDGAIISQAGVSGKFLQRHTSALINLAWMNGFFWDGGAKNIESLSFAPLFHSDEMSSNNISELLTKLNEHSEYPYLFKAFGEDSITIQGVARALAQFQRTLISANSRYDKYVRKEPGGYLNETELNGLKLLRENCGNCHSPDLFTDNEYHNNGISENFIDVSNLRIHQGRFRITLDSNDLGKFKTPTVRNTKYTAPYMHDGRFITLLEVLNHYSGGIKFSSTLDTLFIKNNKLGLKLSQDEKNSIIKFLNTLNDEDFIKNPDYSKP